MKKQAGHHTRDTALRVPARESFTAVPEDCAAFLAQLVPDWLLSVGPEDSEVERQVPRVPWIVEP